MNSQIEKPKRNHTHHTHSRAELRCPGSVSWAQNLMKLPISMLFRQQQKLPPQWQLTRQGKQQKSESQMGQRGFGFGELAMVNPFVSCQFPSVIIVRVNGRAGLGPVFI